MNNIEAIREKIDIEISKIKLEKNIRAIILYGSYARGTDTTSSDVDILIVSNEDIIESKYIEIEKTLKEIFENKQIDLSIYTSDKFEILLENGSLFMHHVKLEGQVIYGKDEYSSKEYLFGKLTKFKGITEDELLYKRMLEKTILSINSNSINYFDLNYMALLARNSMIILCYYYEDPAFGKIEVYEKCKEIFDQEEFPLQLDIYEELLQYRVYYKRGYNKIKLPNQARCNTYQQQMKDLIDFSLKKLDVDNSIDRVYFILKNGVGKNLYTSYEIFTDFDRDIYFGLNKYLDKNYKVQIDSISPDFINLLLENYKQDKFILSIAQVIQGMVNIREKSSTYSIDTPDIYSDIKVNDKLHSDKAIKLFNENENIKKMRKRFKWFNNIIIYFLNYLEERKKLEKLENFIYQIDTVRKSLKNLDD